MIKSIVTVFVILSIFVIIDEAFAKNYPSWMNDVFTWYENGEISEQEMENVIEFLGNLGILDSHECSGNARCITGTVTSVIDGDTIKVDGQSIRFALASAPELLEFNGPEARNFIDEICPVGSVATVDEDDGQTQGSYGRILGVIFCNGMNLNEELLDSGLGYLSSEFCNVSEFAEKSWAQHGCVSIQEIQSDCDESYPDFCIPTSPPDLDCGDIPQKRFTVLQPDPHRFDGDKDGIGCE